MHSLLPSLKTFLESPQQLEDEEAPTPSKRLLYSRRVFACIKGRYREYGVQIRSLIIPTHIANSTIANSMIAVLFLWSKEARVGLILHLQIRCLYNHTCLNLFASFFSAFPLFTFCHEFRCFLRFWAFLCDMTARMLSLLKKEKLSHMPCIMSHSN